MISAEKLLNITVELLMVVLQGNKLYSEFLIFNFGKHIVNRRNTHFYPGVAFSQKPNRILFNHFLHLSPIICRNKKYIHDCHRDNFLNVRRIRISPEPGNKADN